MRAIERTTQFKRDFKREMKGRHRTALESALAGVLGALVRDTPLAEKFRDHPLSGDWSGFRDCHVKPDLVLIYEKPDTDTLRLCQCPPETARAITVAMTLGRTAGVTARYRPPIWNDDNALTTTAADRKLQP